MTARLRRATRGDTGVPVGCWEEPCSEALPASQAALIGADVLSSEVCMRKGSALLPRSLQKPSEPPPQTSTGAAGARLPPDSPRARFPHHSLTRKHIARDGRGKGRRGAFSQPPALSPPA
ncbi:hypothetical protein SKAU_G00213160 [Synaphobranchus kaupii]|uniref:Uncharacterized protein n=1 Tax=Synaphobranchus kaupii TaxID=118154 RepID=A0A9Q1IUR9_SYNKA|nr:hypothetical protein SKAU_G00213160 [Synaphobranchus kaupii]